MVKDTNERMAFNLAVRKTRQEQRNHVLRPKMGWNGFSWLRTGISGGYLSIQRTIAFHKMRDIPDQHRYGIKRTSLDRESLKHRKACNRVWLKNVSARKVTGNVNTLRTGSFKLFKRPFPGFLTILTL